MLGNFLLLYINVLQGFLHFFHILFSFAQNSVNARESKIPYPWLVFNEKIKVNSVFLRDSTAVSDSVLLLFGGGISRGHTVSCLVVYFYSTRRRESLHFCPLVVIVIAVICRHHHYISGVNLVLEPFLNERSLAQV